MSNREHVVLNFPMAAKETVEEDEISADERRDRQVFFQLLGPIKKYLDDDLVQNIDVNEDGSIFYERFGEGVLEAPERMSASARKTLISYLANVDYGRAMDSLHSRLQCDLPIYGSRVQAFALPVANWAMTIRQHQKKVLPLRHYIEREILDQSHAEFLEQALRDELNIGVAGPVNSGKTTFMNALLDRKADLFPDHRAVVVQDRLEVRADRFRNKLHLLARVEQAHHESNGSVARYTYEFSDALEDALRCRQDFLVWGEVRDGYSAFGLTMALNTGTKGLLTTTHANSGLDTLYRIESLLLLNGKVPVRRMIANVFNVVVFMERDHRTGRRKVNEVIRVLGVDDAGDYVIERVGAERKPDDEAA